VGLPPSVVARLLGQRAPRRDPQDGREAGAASNQASWMGNRHASLSHGGGPSRRVPLAPAIHPTARSKAEPRQWWSRCLESRSPI
jgi:hypothetical protein